MSKDSSIQQFNAADLSYKTVKERGSSNTSHSYFEEQNMSNSAIDLENEFIGEDEEDTLIENDRKTVPIENYDNSKLKVNQQKLMHISRQKQYSDSESGSENGEDFNQHRLVLKYPDGTYSYAFKSDDPKCWMEVRQKGEAGAIQDPMVPSPQNMQDGYLNQF